MRLVQIVRIPIDGVATFQRYESAVLPLLPAYGASLDQRLRNADGTVELHVMTFPSAQALDAYRADPERGRHLHLLEESRAVSELLEVTVVTESEPDARP